MVSQWDLVLALDALFGALFEPIDMLSYKIEFLLASCIGDIRTCAVCPPVVHAICAGWLQNDVAPNPRLHPKGACFVVQSVGLRADIFCTAPVHICGAAALAWLLPCALATRVC